MKPNFRIAHCLRTVTGLLVVSVLMGCGGGISLNPFKWFGTRDQAIAVIEAPSDPRPLIDSVVSINVEQMRSGILVTAVGRGVTQGAWQAALVPQPVSDDQLILEFRAFGTGLAPSGPERSREVTVGLHLSRGDVQGLDRIIVQGANNAKSARP